MIAEVSGNRMANILRPVIELLAGIPSVLYGVFGYAVIAKGVRAISPVQVGDSLLAVIIVCPS
jgi:phosphate transport system permease protein